MSEPVLSALEQRAIALESEVEQRKELERALRGVIEERRRAHAALELLQAITASLAKAVALPDVARAVIEEGTAAMRASDGAIWLRGEKHGVLDLVHSTGMSAAMTEKYAHISVRDYAHLPISRSLNEGSAIWIESRAAFDEAFPESAAADDRSDIAFCCLPLRVDGRTLGAFSMSFPSARAFMEDERRFLMTIAYHCAQALDRARLFDALQRANEEALAMNRIKDEFLGTVSHELRTPLNAILGWASMVRTRPDIDVSKAIETIERNARAQGRLIEDILDASRIISGKIRIEPKTIDLAGVVRASALVVAPAAMAKEIALGVTIDKDPCPFYGDGDRLQQVCWNLLANAVKFTPKGGRVDVRLARVAAGVELTVSDSGCGVRPDFLPHMFDRFRQADTSTTRTERGLGLGLAIVRYITELHGGTVDAESAGEGCGATFTVTMPVAPFIDAQASIDGVPSSHGPDAPNDSASIATRPLAGVLVVVCDDEADARALLLEVLAPAGAEVRTAESAAEALAHFRDARPDVLVSDIGLPLVDGYGLIREVRSLPDDRGGRTPAIAVTAYAGGHDARKAFLAGYQLHVAKPIEPSTLVEMVANLAGRGNG